MGNNNQLIGNIVMLVVIFAAFYFFLIRPQKKKDKQVQDMRNGLQVGDEIVTIGGICGKIVKTSRNARQSSLTTAPMNAAARYCS